MKFLRRKVWIPLYLCIAIFAAIASPQVLAAKHALLIGIEDYLDTPHFRKRNMQQLSGPRNDVEILKELFQTEPFQFPEENIVTLLDEQATHSSIEKAFKDLAARVKKDEFVYIHYSGHGSTHDNFDDDEISGKDQTWVTYGASDANSKDSRDIIDDQINIWLAEIGKKTERIVFVSDSCHSGSVSRGPLLGVRAIEKDNRPYPKIEKRADIKPVGIRIGSSGDTENAYEFRQGDKSYGRFTWHWVKSLKMIKPGETWGDIFHRTEALMREETMTGFSRILQQPQIASLHRHHQNSVVLGGEIPENLNRIIVTAIDDNNKVRLNSGQINNVTKGSIYTIKHTSGESSEVEITHVEVFSSEAKIVKGAVQAGDTLIESHRAYSFDPIPVVIEGDALVGQDQIKTISQKIAEKLGLQEYKIVKERQNEGLIIRLFKPQQRDGEYVKEASNATLPKSHPGSDLQAWVLNMQEDVLDDVMHVNLATDLEQGIDKLATNMGIYIDLLDLKKLNNSPPDIQIKVHQLIKDDTCAEGNQANSCFRLDGMFRITKTTNLAQINGQQLPQGSVIGFSVENNTHSPYYVYLLSMSLRDGGFVQFPHNHRHSEYALIKPNESKLIEGGALAFPNAGQEIVKVIMSLKSLDTRAFEFKGTEDYRRSAAKGPQEHLEQLLNRTARRAKNIRAPDPSEWGTMQAEMAIVTKKDDAVMQ